jgi:DNA-binding NtrC family response regulator
VLLIDDDALLRRSACDALARRGYEAHAAGSLAEAWAALDTACVDVVLLDEQLPDGRGHQACARILEQCPEAKIVFMTAFPEFEHAVRALRAGAFDYLTKPFELEALLVAVDRCVTVAGLESVARVESFRRRRHADGVVLVGDSPAFAEVRRLVEVAAGSDAPALVTGETGVGKGLVARAIHAAGPRRDGAFVPLSCAALPDHLVEAELFGWERGAFTGAVASHDGAFGMADGGTLFLDEIGELPLHLQPKLLAALEDRAVRRIGGRAARALDVRVVAATNADLPRLIAEKRFRADLYYRLDVIHIAVPPLRERAADIPALARHLLGSFAGRRAPLALDEARLAELAGYPWPGNVRELRNVLERAALLGRLSLGRAEAPAPAAASAAFPTLAELERGHIARALERTGGNVTQAAQLLGVSLSTLKRRVREGAG